MADRPVSGATAKLRYATNATGSWVAELIETRQADVFPALQLALDAQGVPQIVYQPYGADLRWGRRGGTGWVVEAIPLGTSSRSATRSTRSPAPSPSTPAASRWCWRGTTSRRASTGGSEGTRTPCALTGPGGERAWAEGDQGLTRAAWGTVRPMRVVVTGATGFVGRRLCGRLLARGDEVVALTRDPARATAVLPAGVKALGWTPGKRGPWAEALDGAAGVVHLASEAPKQRRFDAAYWKVLRGSRVEGTLALVEAMAALPRPPPVLVSASAITVYGERGDEVLHEDSSLGTDASAQLCADWEAAALTAERHGIRAVPMRIGFALGREGGPMEPVLGLFRWYLGARLGHPEQWIAWIHVDDLTGFVAHALVDGAVRGVHNLTAPAPARAADFFRAVGEATGRPCWLALSDPLLRAMLGDLAPMLLSSLRALPTRTLASGYRFQYPALPEALRNL